MSQKTRIELVDGRDDVREPLFKLVNQRDIFDALWAHTPAIRQCLVDRLKTAWRLRQRIDNKLNERFSSIRLPRCTQRR